MHFACIEVLSPPSTMSSDEQICVFKSRLPVAGIFHLQGFLGDLNLPLKTIGPEQIVV